MKRLLFVRGYKTRRGGHLTVRDYFLHSMAHPDIDPYLYFLPGAITDNDVWAGIPRDRLVTELNPLDYDALFIGGRTWHNLPDDLGSTKVINVILHVRHATNPKYRKFLRRPAYRIANAQEVYDAVAPFANGPLEVINESIDFGMFPSGVEKVPGSVMIYGQKNPGLADRLSAELSRDGVNVIAFNDGKPQEEFAHLMASSEIYVCLPNRTEGMYRPPLEAMACRSAVVCSDAVGTRSYAIKDETCLQPAYDDFAGYLDAIRRLLSDHELRNRLVDNGGRLAQQFTLERQRELYHGFLDRYIVADSPIEARSGPR